MAGNGNGNNWSFTSPLKHSTVSACLHSLRQISGITRISTRPRVEYFSAGEAKYGSAAKLGRLFFWHVNRIGARSQNWCTGLTSPDIVW